MEWSFLFFFNSALLGVGLAMDAFSVSMANGLHDPQMSRRRGVQIAGTFAIFQAVMPMTGWICVHTIVELFSSFEKFIPWIALILLGYIGGKMLIEGIKGEETEEATELSAGALFMQGVATSIDALSVGFTISEYGWFMALVCSLIVAIVTFFICEAGLAIGKKFGTKLSGKASVLGGVILIVCVVRAILAVAFVRVIGIFVVLFLVAEERFRQVGQIIVDGLNIVLQLPVRLVHALHLLCHVAHCAEDFQQQLVAVLLHVELHARRKALQVAHFVRQFAHVQPS